MRAVLRFLRSKIGLTISVVLVIGALLGVRTWLSTAPLPQPSTLPTIVSTVSDKPDREITSDHQVKRIRHKDAAGLSPLELVKTPAGMVTIQRTFSAGGTLLREEAFLDGKPVAVPTE